MQLKLLSRACTQYTNYLKTPLVDVKTLLVVWSVVMINYIIGLLMANKYAYNSIYCILVVVLHGDVKIMMYSVHFFGNGEFGYQ